MAYEISEGVGDIEEIVDVLLNFKDDEIDQPPPKLATDAHKPEERVDVHGHNDQEMHDDERVIVSLRFIEDNEFIQTPEFKDFLFKMKMK